MTGMNHMKHNNGEKQGTFQIHCAPNILCVIGKSPLIQIGRVYAKLETTNPSGSVKDRMANYMADKAEKSGALKPGTRIIEVTSGNTGIAFAMIAAHRGYRFTAVMPASMSLQRRHMMEAFKAEIILTPAEEDMAGAVIRYNELIKEYPDAWLPRQFENPDNIAAHREGLGREIVEQTNGRVDAFVAGIGTGGTLIGVAQALKEANPSVKIIGVEPEESAVLSGGKPGFHEIQGIGEGFIPKLIQDHMDLIDEIITIKSNDARVMGERLAKKYGILVGISSGANILAARKARKYFRHVVTVLSDRGERYL
jgi:cysteine synthase A